MAKAKTVAIDEPIVEKKEQVEEKKGSKNNEKDITAAPTFRIITGSYEHNLMCLSLTLYKGKQGSISEVFTPIFHFTAHTQSLRCLASTNRYLVSGSNDEHIKIYDLQKRKELGTLLHHSGSITSLEFYQNKWLLSGSGDGKMCLWRVKDWEVLGEMKGHSGEINDISVHPTGRLALTAGADKTLRLWNLMTAKKASIMKLRQEPRKARWSEDGAHYIVGFDRSISIYSTEDSQVVHEFKLASQLQHMDLCEINGEYRLVTSHSNGQIVCRKFKPLMHQEDDSFELSGHASRVKHFSVYHHVPNKSDYMTTVSSDGKIVVHDLAQKDQIAVYDTGDRLNCCLVVPEDVEKYDTMKKRKLDAELSEVEETDFSGESETEQPKKQPKKKKNKNKKPKVTVEMD